MTKKIKKSDLKNILNTINNYSEFQIIKPFDPNNLMSNFYAYGGPIKPYNFDDDFSEESQKKSFYDYLLPNQTDIYNINDFFPVNDSIKLPKLTVKGKQKKFIYNRPIKTNRNFWSSYITPILNKIIHPRLNREDIKVGIPPGQMKYFTSGQVPLNSHYIFGGDYEEKTPTAYAKKNMPSEMYTVGGKKEEIDFSKQKFYGVKNGNIVINTYDKWDDDDIIVPLREGFGDSYTIEENPIHTKFSQDETKKLIDFINKSFNESDFVYGKSKSIYNTISAGLYKLDFEKDLTPEYKEQLNSYYNKFVDKNIKSKNNKEKFNQLFKIFKDLKSGFKILNSVGNSFNSFGPKLMLFDPDSNNHLFLSQKNDLNRNKIMKKFKEKYPNANYLILDNGRYSPYVFDENGINDEDTKKYNELSFYGGPGIGYNFGYAYGGSPINYMTPEQTAFMANRIAEDSMYQANAEVAPLKAIGGLAMNAGLNLMTSGLSKMDTSLGKFVKDNKDGIDGLGKIGIGALMSNLAYGGTPDSTSIANNAQVGNNPLLNMLNQLDNVDGTVPAEIEGGEVVQTPTGQMFDISGPSHEQGGVPVQLPKAAEVYSNRIKIDGVSLSDRKKKREKRSIKLEELLELDKTDSLIKNSLKRTNEVNQQEEDLDKELQQYVGSILPQPKKEGKYAYGTPKNNFLPNSNLFKESLDLLNYLKASRNPVPSMTNPDPVIEPFEVFKLGQLGEKLHNQEIFNRTGVERKSNPPTYDQGYFSDNPIDLSGLKNLQKQLGNKSTLDSEERVLEKISKKPLLNTILSDILDGVKKYNPLSNASTGDLIKMGGNLYQGIKPLQTTLRQREGDLPNINHFKNYGEEAKNTIEKSLQLINSMKDESVENTLSMRNASINSNHQNALGLNMMRIMDMASDAQTQDQLSKIDSTYNQSLLGLLNNKANVDLQIDATKMKGEYERDMNDRKDRDAFFTQLNSDYANIGQAIAQTGADINAAKLRDSTINLLNAQYSNVQLNSDGELEYKGAIPVASQKSNTSSILSGTSKDLSKYIDKYTVKNFDLSKISTDVQNKINSGQYGLDKQTGLLIHNSGTKILDIRTGKEINIK